MTEQTALYETAGLYTSRDYQRARELAEAALERARDLGDRRSEGLALNRLGNVLTNLEQFSAGRTLHEQALALFEAADDRLGTADSYDRLGMTDYLRGDVMASRAAFGRAAEMFAALDSPSRVASALTSGGLYLAVLDGPCGTDAPPAIFHQDALRGLELSREIDWRAGEAFALVALACAGIGNADYRAAADQLDAALAIAQEIGHPQWTVIARITYGILFADIFDDRRAKAQFGQALAVAQDLGFAQWETRLKGWIARCHARLGDLDVAGELLAPLLPSSLPDSIRERRALTTHAEIALLCGRPDDAQTTLELLLAAGGDPPPAATVLLQARALVTQGEREAAAAAFARAEQLADAYGPRSARWQAAAGIAQLGGASDAARRAREEVSAIAAALPDEWAAHFLSVPEVRPWLEPARSTARQTAGPFELTRREREVAALVAEGLTNKQIASRLSVAEKTIEMHVSNCLGKLGFHTRAQLAGWVVTHGLADPPSTQG